MKIPIGIKPYPEEIFYSWIARYHKLSGNKGYTHTYRQLFGKDYKYVSLYVPNGLGYFVENISSKMGMDYIDIINKHTLYPYYRPFISVKNQQEIERTIIIGESTIEKLIGLTSANCKKSKELYYCPVCIKENNLIYGMPFFHRIHQIQGVYICLEHLL